MSKKEYILWLTGVGEAGSVSLNLDECEFRLLDKICDMLDGQVTEIGINISEAIP